MDNVPNNAFHTLVTDGVTEQILFLIECDMEGNPFYNFYLSSDGDMTSEGATFTDELTSEDNYTLGCIPSRTMSVSLMNEDGHLNGHSYGWVSAHIGVSVNHWDITPVSGVNVYIDYQGQYQQWDGRYECRTDGFYRDNTLVLSGNCTGAFINGTGYAVFFIEESGKPVGYVYDMTTGSHYPLANDVTAGLVTDEFVNKFANGRIINIDSGEHTFEDIHTEYGDGYWIANMGHFRVDKPSKTMGKTVNITDAFDLVHELDVDASAFLATNTRTNGWDLFSDIYNYYHFNYMLSSESIRSRLEALPVDMAEVRKNSYTARKLLSYLFEAVGCNARMLPREGLTVEPGLYIFLPYDETKPTAYPITETRIAANSLEIQEYVCHEVDRVSVKNLDGETKMYPSVGDYCYEYDGNPFVPDATRTQFSYVRQIPQYQPMTFHLIEADPSFQVGDLIKVELTYGDDEVLTDYFGRDIVNHRYEEILIVPSEGKWVVPIMAQTILWNGKTSATIEAKGSEIRSGYSSGNYTDFNSRVNSGGASGGNISQFTNDVGYLTLQTLPIYGADVQIVYNGEVT